MTESRNESIEWSDIHMLDQPKPMNNVSYAIPEDIDGIPVQDFMRDAHIDSRFFELRYATDNPLHKNHAGIHMMQMYTNPKAAFRTLKEKSFFWAWTHVQCTNRKVCVVCARSMAPHLVLRNSSGTSSSNQCPPRHCEQSRRSETTW